MTPKEKAKQLAIKFTNNTDVIKPNLASIEKALLCVSEQKELLIRMGTATAQYEYNELTKIEEELHQL